MTACGIDFGTSNSTVGWMRPGQHALLALEDGRPTLPSAIFFHDEDDEVSYGRAAIADYVAGYDGRLMRSMKSLLGSSLMEGHTEVAGRALPFKVLLTRFMVGAAGVIGSDYVAKSAKDGATLLLTSSTFLTSAATQPRMPYDPVKSFAPVAMVGEGPLVIGVTGAKPYASLADVLEAARAKPDVLNYGTAGIGSLAHLATVMMNDAAHVSMTHVPYKGAANAASDMAGGQLGARQGPRTLRRQRLRAALQGLWPRRRHGRPGAAARPAGARAVHHGAGRGAHGRDGRRAHPDGPAPDVLCPPARRQGHGRIGVLPPR
jgi:hypothetical protein